jgi:hypothetical protein
VRKVAKRAGVAAPAVAVAGALAAAPHLHTLTAAAPPAFGAATAAGAAASAQLSYPDPAGNVTSALPASQSRAEYQPRHARKAAARPRSTAAPSRAAPSTSSTASPGSSASVAAAGGSQPPQAASRAGVSCSASASGPLPAHYAAIMSFLTAHGYTGNAAAGIAGNIYQESGGNPESEGDGGGGLIGWTPLPAGYVTGNPSADLQTQLEAILAFNHIWSQYIPALNAASSPAAAADIYVTDFERAGIPAASNREAAATAVAAACGI